MQIAAGLRCELDADECWSRPCRNEGVCNNVVSSNTYTCTCMKGFFGADCQLDVDECLSFPCQKISGRTVKLSREISCHYPRRNIMTPGGETLE